MKVMLKKTFKLVFRVLLLPLYLWFLLLVLVANEDSVFQTFSQYLSLIPGRAGSYCRAAFYWWACPNTSDDISIGFLTVFSHRDTTLNKGVYIGPQCNIGKCSIGASTLVGSGVQILSGNKQHFFEDPNKRIQDQGGKYEKVLIGEDCWLGNCSIVMSSISDNCILSSGGVLTTDVTEKGVILAGNPARMIRSRGENSYKNNSGLKNEKPST